MGLEHACCNHFPGRCAKAGGGLPSGGWGGNGGGGAEESTPVLFFIPPLMFALTSLHVNNSKTKKFEDFLITFHSKSSKNMLKDMHFCAENVEQRLELPTGSLHCASLLVLLLVVRTVNPESDIYLH